VHSEALGSSADFDRAAHLDQSSSSASAGDMHEHPNRGKAPVTVSLGLYVTDIIAIDETRETYEIGGYLISSWRDPV